MTNIDALRLRNQSTQLEFKPGTSSVNRFRSFLHADDDSHEKLEATEDGTAQTDGAEDAFADVSGRLPKGVMRFFWESLQQEFSNTQDVVGFLNALLLDVSGAFQVTGRLQGVPWRFLVRLRPDFLAATVLEINFKNNCIGVIFRTASKEAYATISDALPRLNAALVAKNFSSDEASLYLVGIDDLP